MDVSQTDNSTLNSIYSFRYSHKTNQRFSSKRKQATSKFLFTHETVNQKSNSDGEYKLQYGIADYIGFAGYNVDDLPDTSFPFPFSTSLQLPPVLLQTFNCEELKNKFPNKLEWFCFPNGVHLRREIPDLIFDNVPKSVIAAIEYLIQCLPCNPLFSAPVMEKESVREVVAQLSKYDHVTSPDGRFINLNSFDFQPEEVVAGLKVILERMPSLVPFSLQRMFSRISFDEFNAEHTPSITIKAIKSILRRMRKSSLLTLFYILSFIRVFLQSNQEGCEVFGEDSDSVTPQENDDSVESLRQLAIYYNQMDFPYRCLFTPPITYVRNGLEEICQFFFECSWQPRSEQFNEDQRNGLYSIFMLLVLNYDTIFEQLLNGDGYGDTSPVISLSDSEKSFSYPSPRENESSSMIYNDLFSRYPLQHTSYTILCSSSSTYYCCLLTYYQEHKGMYVPTTFFLLTTIPMPKQLCNILEPILYTLGDTDNGKQLFSFLLRDCLCPIPDALDVRFTVGGFDLCLHATETKDRLHNIACVKELFQRMSTDKIVNLLLLLLCEEKLLFVSNQLDVLPMILEGLLLLLPYPWPHGFIPTVPIYLLPILIDTPSPFLFGTSATSFAYIRSTLSSDIKVIFLREEPLLSVPPIPVIPRRWLVNRLNALDATLSDYDLYHQAKQVISCFYWKLFPSFSQYLYTLLGNTCLFNSSQYVTNEVSEEYHLFYTQILATQSFAMLVDHFWSVQYRDFVACMEMQSEAPLWSNPSYYTISYPSFSFSSPLQQKLISSFSFDSISSKDRQLVIDDTHFLQGLPKQPSAAPRSKELIEAFSHPIMSAINRLLSCYLLDNSSEYSPDLLEFVSDGLVEPNVRVDFLRILYQPTDGVSPFRIISQQSASSLASLFLVFYSNCVQQRDYVNALKLHKITSLFLVLYNSRKFPLYGLCSTHDIYTKVGFWRELLMDYCATYEEDPSYQMKFSCLDESRLCSLNFGIAEQGYVSIMLGEDPSTEVSSDIMSKAFSYLGNLMMDLRLSEENANRIVLTVLQLINGCKCLFE